RCISWASLKRCRASRRVASDGEPAIPLPTLFGGGQFVRLVMEMPDVPRSPHCGFCKHGAAIILPALDLDRREAMVWRCRADRFFQAIDRVFFHVCPPFRYGRAGSTAQGLRSAELGGIASDGEPATPVASRQ